MNSEQKTGEPELVLTDNAMEQIKRLLARDNRQDHGLRVSVANGGCSGFSYRLNFEKEPAPGDAVITRSGLRIFIDGPSAAHIKGTVIDFAAGVYGGGFKFTNPNATGTCGCGTSFST